MRFGKKSNALEYVPGRDDWIVAYCPQCAANLEGHIPAPRTRVRCRNCRQTYRLPPADSKKRFNLLLRHLRGKNDLLVQRAQLGLRAFGADSEEWLIRELLAHANMAERIMPILGEVGGRRAADVLIGELRECEKSIRWRKWLWRWVGLAVVIVSLRLFGYWGMFSLFFVGGMLSKERFQSYRSNGADALAQIRDPRAIGAMAVAYRDRSVRATARAALRTLLPLAREEHAPDVFGKERKALHDLTTQSQDVELALLATQTLARVGNQQTMHHLIRISSGRGVHPLVMSEARRVIPLLKSSMEVRAQQSTLLRAANAAESHSGQLLRPAGQGEAELTHLLRANAPSDQAAETHQTTHDR